MALWLIAAQDADPEALARARVVRQGFSWPAFWLAPFWLLYHREWLLLVVWLLAMTAFAALVGQHLPSGATLISVLLAHVWLGLEAPRWRGRRLKGLVDLVEAPTRDAAERRYFAQLLPRRVEVDRAAIDAESATA